MKGGKIKKEEIRRVAGSRQNAGQKVISQHNKIREMDFTPHGGGEGS